MKSVGEIIKERRVAKGWTQVQFAETIGIKSTQVWNWESGFRIPNAENRVKIAEALGFDVREIL